MYLRNAEDAYLRDLQRIPKGNRADNKNESAWHVIIFIKRSFYYKIDLMYVFS